MKLITLQQWSDSNFSIKFGVETLNKWARNGTISPQPIKVGGRWMVHPQAQYIETTIEAQRTERAQKELKNHSVSDTVLSEKLLRIVNNGPEAA